MNNSLDAGDLDYAAKAGLLDCTECGSCAYICPARIKLVQRFRTGKHKIRQKQALRNTAAAAERAKRMAENFIERPGDSK
jgi:electron transport complex protein RnfC